MGRTISVRFKDGVPVSNARDPKKKREAEAMGRAFLDALDKGGDPMNLVTPNPELPEEAQAVVADLLRKADKGQ